MKITELDKDTAFAIRYAMEKRAEAKELEDRAEAIRKEADEVLLPLLSTLDDMKAEDETLGSVSVVCQTRSTLNQDIAKENLLANGVDAGVIALAWTVGTKTTTSTSVRYTRPKVSK